MSDIKEIMKKLVEFRDERDWKQFHNAKDLSIALSIEVNELLELFLWKGNSEVDQVDPERIKEELADVFAYAFLLAEKYNLDIAEIVAAKMKKNAAKYPIEKAKGNSAKYDSL